MSNIVSKPLFVFGNALAGSRRHTSHSDIRVRREQATRASEAAAAMVRARENWEKLVRATLKREQLRNAGQGHARVPSGIAGAVPPSLAETTNIDLILQAADEIQSEDPNVARICRCFNLLNWNLFACFKFRCCVR